MSTLVGRGVIPANSPPSPFWGPACAPPSPSTYVYKFDMGNFAAGEILFGYIYDFLQSPANMLALDQASFESSSAGYISTGCTLAQTAAQALDGTHSLAMTSTASPMFAETPNSPNGQFRVVPGQTYQATVALRAATVGRQCRITARFRTASGVIFQDIDGAIVNDITTGWVIATVIVTAPLNADTMAAYVTVGSPGVGEVHYVDCMTIGPTDGNLLTANQSSLETDTTGWAAGANTTIARDTANAVDGGASLKMTSVAGGDMGAITPTGNAGFAVSPGTACTFMASFRSAVSVRSCQVIVQWYKADGASSAVHATDISSSVADATTGWTQVTLAAAAPSDAVWAAIQLKVLATGAANEVHYADAIGAFIGSGATWEPGIGAVGSLWTPGQYNARIVEHFTFNAGIDGADLVTVTIPLTTETLLLPAFIQQSGSGRAVPWKLYSYP